MHASRFIGRLALAVALTAPLLGYGAQRAFAVAGDSNCPHGGNVGSTACFYGVTQYSDYVQFHNNNMYYLNPAYEQAGEHINQSIWAYSGSPCSSWVEQGVTQGYHGEVAYEWYLAFNQTNNNYQDFREGYTSPDGSTHSYWLNYNGSSGAYYVIRDGTTLAFVGNLGYGTCIAQTGLEISRDANGVASAHADTFDDVPLAWYDTSWNLHYGWNTSQYWIDWPCGQYLSPYCFNGSWYGLTHWANNKP